MKPKAFEPIIYIIVLFLYLSEGTSLLGNLKVLTLGSHLLFIVLSLYYAVLVFFRCPKSAFIKIFFLLFTIISLYGILLIMFPMEGTWVVPEPSNYFLRRHFRSLAPVFAFYYFTINGIIDEQWMRYAFIVFVGAAVLDYFRAEARLYEMMQENNIEETTSNSGYYWVALLPALAFFKKRPIILYLGMVVLSILILSSFKRGAILSALVIDLFYIWFLFRHNNNRSKALAIIVAGIAIYAIYMFVQYLSANSDYFNIRVEQTMAGYSSNRDTIYKTMWNLIKESDGLSFIFGHGADATRRLTGKVAHCDWLEYAVDMGLLGVTVYASYWISSIKMLKKSSRKVNDLVIMSLAAVLIINFIKSLISMSTDDMSFYMSSVLGFCSAECYKD